NNTISFTFNNNGNKISYKAQFFNSQELIINIENHTNGYRLKNRYSIIDKFPIRNDNIEYNQEFYPIVLLPNKIIQNIKSDVSKEKVYEYLNITLPKLEKIRLPSEPKNYRYVKKEKSKFQGDGCTSIAQIPMVLFFVYMLFYSMENGKPLLGLLFLVLVLVLGKSIFDFKTITITEKEIIPSDIYSNQIEKYKKDKKSIEEKNIDLEKEYNKKLKKIDVEITSKMDFAKHQ